MLPYFTSRVRLHLLIGFVLLTVTACQRKVTAPSRVDIKQEATTLRIAISVEDSVFLGLRNTALVRQFYQQADFRSSWFDKKHPTSSADSLTAFIRCARYYGLSPKPYHVEELQDTSTTLSRADVLLTDAFLSLAQDLRYGTRVAMRSVEKDSVRLIVLNHATESNRIAEDLRNRQPPYSGCRALRDVLRKMIDSLAPEQRWSALLHNDSTETRLTQIETNLERWREERAPYRGRYILINIPSFMLYVMQDDSVLMSSRVIVGEPETPTPELSSRISRLVTYPYWHVPRKIAVKEYLPALQQDVSIIDKNNFDVLDRMGRLLDPDSVPWSSYTPDYFPVSLRQREGSENALGVIKFEFSNPYTVFLHDTNARKLFQQSVRAFSHGCIRMEKAEALAHYLVTGSLNVKSKKLTELLTKQERHVLRLSEPIPIYVRYFTAEVRGGKLMIYPDLYQKDEGRAF